MVMPLRTRRLIASSMVELLLPGGTLTSKVLASQLRSPSKTTSHQSDGLVKSKPRVLRAQPRLADVQTRPTTANSISSSLMLLFAPAVSDTP